MLGYEPFNEESQIQYCEAFISSVSTTATKFTKTNDVRHFFFCCKKKTGENLLPSFDGPSHNIKRGNFLTYVRNTAHWATEPFITGRN